MRTLLGGLSALCTLAGLAFLVQALLVPAQYPLAGASAVQVTQVYIQALFPAVLGLACLLLAALGLLTAILLAPSRPM